MWTYRIEDANDCELTLTETGTVYVIMDSEGKDRNWFPPDTPRETLRAYCRYMAENYK